MSFLPPGFAPCMLAAVIGVGRFSALLVGRWWKGSVGTVIIDNASQAGIIIFKEPVFLCKAVYFCIQTVNIIFVFDFFCVKIFFHRIKASHDFHKLIVQSFFIIAAHS